MTLALTSVPSRLRSLADHLETHHIDAEHASVSSDRKPQVMVEYAELQRLGKPTVMAETTGAVVYEVDTPELNASAVVFSDEPARDFYAEFSAGKLTARFPADDKPTFQESFHFEG